MEPLVIESGNHPVIKKLLPCYFSDFWGHRLSKMYKLCYRWKNLKILNNKQKFNIVIKFSGNWILNQIWQFREASLFRLTYQIFWHGIPKWRQISKDANKRCVRFKRNLLIVCIYKIYLLLFPFKLYMLNIYTISNWNNIIVQVNIKQLIEISLISKTFESRTI